MAVGSQVVRIALQADVGGFVRNFGEAETATGKVGAALGGLVNAGKAGLSAIDAIADSVAAAAKKLAVFGAGTVVSFAGMGIAAASFEAKLKNVQSLLGDEGAAQFSKNFEAVLRITRELPISANDAAEGLYNITSSGFAGADALKVLEVSAVAASAGLATVEGASTSITAILNAYGLGAEKAADVSDVLFQTVNLGVLRFEDLTGVIGDSVGTAAAAGITYAELGSAIATMTLSGISAAEAGTSANRVFQSLIDPSKELSSTFKMMGYDSGLTAISVLGLRGTIEALRVASQGNIQTLMQWFPEIRAARGALALMSAEGQNYARVAGEIENAQARAGATQRAFNAQAESTSMSFQKFINNLKAASIELGSAFLPAAKTILDFLTQIAGAFESIPGPIKNVIAWFGMLSGILLALGGIILAFEAKTFIVNKGLNLFGTGMQKMGQEAAFAGTYMTALGDKVMATQGHFRVTQLLAAGVGTAFNTMGGGVVALGQHIVNLSSHMSVGGGMVSKFGNLLMSASSAGAFMSNAMTRLRGVLSGLVGLVGPVIALGIGMYSAFSQGRAEAEKLADSLMKGFDPNKPSSILSTAEKLGKQMDSVNKQIKSAGESAGGFFTQTVKNIGDALTNIVGADIIKDSSWDLMLKSDKLDEAGKKIVRSARNLTDNVTEIWNSLHPDDMVSKLGLTDERTNYISLVADKLGVSLSKPYEVSGPARQKAAEEIQKLTNYTESLGLSTSVITEGMVANYQAMQKAEAKAAEGAADAANKSADLIKAIDPKAVFPDTEDLIPIGLQITKFYDDTIAKMQTFYDNIATLERRGLDPGVVQKFLQAGPDAAGGIVQAAVEDETNGIIETINRGEALLSEFAQRAAEMARLAQRAINANSDKLVKDLPTAQQISDQIWKQGKFATPESVAEALGLDAGTVRKIAGEFGITLQESINWDQISQSWDIAGLTDNWKSDLHGFFDWMVNETKLAPQAAATLTESLAKTLNMPAFSPTEVAKKKLAFDELKKSVMDLDGLTQDEKNIIINVIGAEQAKAAISDFFKASKFGEPGEGQKTFGGKSQAVMEFLLSVVGQPDAVAKIEDFSRVANLTPEQLVVMLRVLGSPEAVTEADKVNLAISVLKGKNLPVTVENVTALAHIDETGQAVIHMPNGKTIIIDANGDVVPVKVAEAQGHVDKFHGNKATLDVDNTPVNPKTAEAQKGVNSFSGKTVPEDVDNTTVKPKTDESQRTVDAFHGKTPVLDVNTDPVQPGVAGAQRDVDSFHSPPAASLQANDDTGPGVLSALSSIGRIVGKTVDIVINTIEKTTKEAEGGIIPPRHAARGLITHRPGVYAPRFPGVLFAEPETGGESYIPWAMGKRYNAMKVLRTTASAFGYELMQKHYAMNRNGMALAQQVVSRNFNVQSILQLSGPFLGEQHLLDQVRNILDQRDRDIELELGRDRSAF